MGKGVFQDIALTNTKKQQRGESDIEWWSMEEQKTLTGKESRFGQELDADRWKWAFMEINSS